MATSELKMKVTADTNSAKNELQNISRQLTDMNKMSFTKMAAQFDVVTMAAKEVGHAIGKVVDTAKEWVNLYKIQETAEIKLTTALKATGNQYNLNANALKQYAANLQSVTRFGDEAIIEAESLLVATKKLNKEGIERTLEVSADLAEAMGTDITSAASQLAKILQEPTTGLDRLKQSGINFTEQEKEQIKQLTEANRLYEAQALVLDKVEASYGGLAKSLAEVDTGKLDKIKNVWGDIKENLGKGLLDMISPALDILYNRLKDISDLVNIVVNGDPTTNEKNSLLESIATGDFSNWDTATLQKWGNTFYADQMARVADFAEMNKGIDLRGLRFMSAQEMYNKYGTDYSMARDNYVANDNYYNAIVAELSRRMIAEWDAAAIEAAQNAMHSLPKSAVDAETRLLVDNDRLQNGTKGWLANVNGQQTLIPIDTGLYRGFQNGVSPAIAPTDPVQMESTAAVVDRIFAQNLIKEANQKGKNSNDYYSRMMQFYTNGGVVYPSGSSGVDEEPVAIPTTAEEIARIKASNAIATAQAKGKRDNDYYAKMYDYYNNGGSASTSDNNEEDPTTWIQRLKESFKSIKDDLADIGKFAVDQFTSIGDALASMWESQANSIKAEMEQMRKEGTLTLEQEEKMQSEMNSLNQKAFHAKQANAIAEATSAYASGIMNIWKDYASKPVLAGVMTGILTGTYGVQLASISSQSYTPFAKGGIVTGPVHGLIGEAGPEAIIPLSSPTADRMLGSGSGVTVVVNGNIYGNAEEQIFRAIERSQRTGNLPRWSYA